MADISNIQKALKTVFFDIAKDLSFEYKLILGIDECILDEINDKFKETVEGYGIVNPNEAKIASAMAFWIRKLKPIHHLEGTPKTFEFINELSGLLFAFFIYTNSNRHKNINVDELVHALKQKRVFKDLIKSYRYNSHSPHSSTIIFELLFKCHDRDTVI